jgi:hypothetical protein
MDIVLIEGVEDEVEADDPVPLLELSEGTAVGLGLEDKDWCGLSCPLV